MQPAALLPIERKVRDYAYGSNLDEFKREMGLIFTNAREFNDADSEIVADANAMEAVFLQKIAAAEATLAEQGPAGKKARL